MNALTVKPQPTTRSLYRRTLSIIASCLFSGALSSHNTSVLALCVFTDYKKHFSGGKYLLMRTIHQYRLLFIKSCSWNLEHKKGNVSGSFFYRFPPHQRTVLSSQKYKSMAWYEDAQGDCHEDCRLATPLTCLSASDPYRCTLELQVASSDEAHLRELYSPLLRWIDPAFQLLRINRENVDEKCLCKPRFRAPSQTSHRHQEVVSTQSLSIVLFLREDSSNQLTADALQTVLGSAPWKFHHKIELASSTGYRSVAAQDYYECDPGLPLWTVCSVHYGNEQCRFNLFVENFEEMREFYAALTDSENSAMKPGFCVFDLYSQPGLDVKLSLKCSPFLAPRPTKKAFLRFSVRDIINLQSQLSLDVTYIRRGTWLTRDPDGNAVMLSRDDRNLLRVTSVDDVEPPCFSDSGSWRKTSSDSDASLELSSDTVSI